MTDFWFPTPPGLTALPPTPPITTDPNPVPPNTVAAPGGFDPLNPDLDDLFNVVLPVDVPPVYEETMEQTIALTIPAYNLAMTWESVLHLRAQALLFDFGPSTVSVPVTIKIKGSGEVIFSQLITPAQTFRIRVRGDQTTTSVVTVNVPSPVALVRTTIGATLIIATGITPDQTVRIRLQAQPVLIIATGLTPDQAVTIGLVAGTTIISPPVNEFVIPFVTKARHGAVDGTAGWNIPEVNRIVIGATIS